MPRINLLPWREEERKRRQRDFGLAMGGAVLAAIAVIMLVALLSYDIRDPGFSNTGDDGAVQRFVQEIQSRNVKMIA